MQLVLRREELYWRYNIAASSMYSPAITASLYKKLDEEVTSDIDTDTVD